MGDDTIKVSYPRDGIALVEVCGEHDLTTKDVTANLLERLVSDNDVVVVDLCSATFIDSSFLSCLLAADRRAAGQSHELRVHVSDSPNVSNVLNMSGVAEVLTIVSTRDEAIA